MWRNHVCAHPDLTEDILARTGETPIVIDWDASDYPYIRPNMSELPDYMADALDLALTQSHRATHIALQECGEHIARALSKTTASALMLQSMELCDITPDGYGHPYAIPSTTLQTFVTSSSTESLVREFSCRT